MFYFWTLGSLSIPGLASLLVFLFQSYISHFLNSSYHILDQLSSLLLDACCDQSLRTSGSMDHSTNRLIPDPILRQCRVQHFTGNWIRDQQGCPELDHPPTDPRSLYHLGKSRQANQTATRDQFQLCVCLDLFQSTLHHNQKLSQLIRASIDLLRVSQPN